MSMALPRLPSGVYFNLLASTTANEAHYLPEYPAFSTSRRIAEGWTQPPGALLSQDSARPRKIAAVEPELNHPPPQKPQPEVCLPLLSVAIDMQVDCNIAKTTVVQVFTNRGGISIPEAWYSFPLYDGAAVTAFRCEVGDDKVLEGKVKPKDEAKREFQRAVKKQEAAALVDELAPDVFQTTIGNIKPRTSVKVEITYVEELHADLSGEGIVVTIPTSVAPRYGTAPAGYMANSTVKETGLSLIAQVAYPGRARDIVCRSGHNISFEYGKMSHVPEASSFEALAELQNQEDSGLQTHHATVRLSNGQTAMDRDIILFIPFPDNGLLNSRALLAPSSGSDHMAMMVTVRPNELLSDVRQSMDEFEGEVLFLADRSGSMEGSKLSELKDALLLFLKSLPAKCRFNLYSFGSAVSSLWPHSMPYDDPTLQKAMEYVSTFQADFGGTEVLEALKKVVGDRQPTEVPSTQLILLTDGEIWQSEQTIKFVRKTTSEAEGQLRFFSLGIGNRVSHQLIQGIGFFGGGFGETVPTNATGKWKEAVIRMLKGALMPTSWSYSISLGDQWREKRLDENIFSPQQPERTVPESLDRIPAPVGPSFVQAPRVIPSLHHFGQQSVYFLLENNSGKIPDHVIITACSQYGGTKTATLAVTEATSTHTVQHLAAKAVVRDLENQYIPEAALKIQIRKNAEYLCQMYSISSKWTSFVAVSRLQQCAECEDIEISQYKAPLAELDLLTRPSISVAGQNRLQASDGSSSGFSGQFTPLRPTSHLIRSQTQQSITLTAQSSGSSMVGDSYGGPSSNMLIRAYGTSQDTRPELYSTYHELIKRIPRVNTEGPKAVRDLKTYQDDPGPNSMMSCSSSIPPPLRPPPRRPRNQLYKIHSMIAGHDESSSLTSIHSSGVERLQEPNNGPCALDWQELIRYQRADGLFHLGKILENRMIQHFCHGTQKALGHYLEQRMKGPIMDATGKVQMVELVVDTVMALAYIRSHFHSHRALWDLLVQKAERRLASLLNSGEWATPDWLTAMADSAVAHAHYGHCLQPGDEGPGERCSPGNGGCDICDSQGKERMSSAKPSDGFRECSVSGCDVNVDDWGVFWSHAVEKGHIDSSCETARNRWSQNEAHTRAQGQKAGLNREPH